MPEELSEGDYETLDNFIRAALERAEAGDIDADDAHTDIMHVLTAWDHGNTEEFVSWMKAKLEEWEEESDSDD
jgi:hypothetical protein